MYDVINRCMIDDQVDTAYPFYRQLTSFQKDPNKFNIMLSPNQKKDNTEKITNDATDSEDDESIDREDEEVNNLHDNDTHNKLMKQKFVVTSYFGQANELKKFYRAQTHPQGCRELLIQVNQKLAEAMSMQAAYSSFLTRGEDITTIPNKRKWAEGVLEMLKN